MKRKPKYNPFALTPARIEQAILLYRAVRGIWPEAILLGPEDWANMYRTATRTPSGTDSTLNFWGLITAVEVPWLTRGHLLLAERPPFHNAYDLMVKETGK